LGLALDESGNVLVTGFTESSDFPGIRSGSADNVFQGMSETFVAKLDPDLSDNPPDCSGAAASVPLVWPPNHNLVAMQIVGVTDPDADPVTITIDSIAQDEPLRGRGSGNTCPDGSGIGTNTAFVSAERSGNGDGRVYGSPRRRATDRDPPAPAW
jgi:hypothetical protein